MFILTPPLFLTLSLSLLFLLLRISASSSSAALLALLLSRRHISDAQTPPQLTAISKRNGWLTSLVVSLFLFGFAVLSFVSALFLPLSPVPLLGQTCTCTMSTCGRWSMRCGRPPTPAPSRSAKAATWSGEERRRDCRQSRTARAKNDRGGARWLSVASSTTEKEKDTGRRERAERLTVNNKKRGRKRQERGRQRFYRRLSEATHSG